MSLASRLPYDHAYAGGYPGIGSQPLPTDADAIDYLSRMATADGAGVEVGVAMAVDAFVKGCKADGIWDAIKSACIMCGARTLSGALVSLKSYGDELWENPSTLQSIANANGTDGAWDASTQTMSNTTGASVYHPRFRFTLAEPLKQNATYKIEGRLSGDVDAVFGIRPTGSTSYASYNSSTGEFSGNVLQTSTLPTLEILLDTLTSSSSNISLTIESLSVKEYFANPTNVANNFVEADYDRSGGGLKGDGATKYLDSNRANNADGQDDNHNAVYVTAANTTSAAAYLGSGATTSGSNNIGSNVGLDFAFFRSRTSGYGQIDGAASATGLLGISRSSASTYTARASGGSSPVNTASDGVEDDNVMVFARTDAAGTPALFSDARLAFYSIGASLDLAALDTRVSTLVAAIAAAL